MASAKADATLFHASRRGDLEAFRHLVERYQKLVCAVSYSATGDRALSEDVAQETFLAAWHGLDGLRDPGKLRSWLCGIARNLSSKALRRRREVPDSERIDAARDADVGAPAGPFDELADRETAKLVWDALERIPDKYREPLVLYYQQERSVREVSEALGLSEAAVQQRLSRGRRFLRDGVTSLVERALTTSKPRAGLTASIMLAVSAGGGTPASAAGLGGERSVPATSPLEGARSMMILKIGAVIGALAAATTAAYSLSQSSATAPASEAPPTKQAQSSFTADAVGASAQPSTTAGALPAAQRLAAAKPAAPPTTGGSSHEDWTSVLHVKVDGQDEHEDIEDAKPALVKCIHEAMTTKHEPGASWSYVLDVGIQEGVATSANVAEFSQPFDTKSLAPCVVAALSSADLSARGASARIALAMKSTPNPAPSPEMVEALGIDDGQARGAAEGAPVTVVVFTDYRCKFCGKALGILDELLAAYPGQLRAVVKHFPVRGDDSTLAARAAVSAANQGQFWPLHDALFANQDDLDRDAILALADDLGLDMARFTADLDAETTAQQIETERDEGMALGVQGTPTFFINGTRLSGARPIEHFRQLIDDELASAK